MLKNYIKIYDKNFEFLGFLQNASNINYETRLNEIWGASFDMPSSDEKNIYCEAFNFVEIFEMGRRIEMFRILPSNFTKSGKKYITYECEHVISTLIDIVLFGYHQIGNNGVYTDQVIRYILDKQSLWKLGRCAFKREFEYKWENENLLAALFSIPQPFKEKYKWVYDTSAKPFIIHLDEISDDDDPSCEIRYKKNMQGITKETDPTNIVTRLYCLGYGEGDNQLNIKSINNGLPYLQAEQSIIDKWGIRESIWIDRRFESAETLKSTGEAMLNELKQPYISYTVDAIDISGISESEYDRFTAGKIARVIDKEDGIEFKAIIVETSKNVNSPDVRITIANKNRNIAGSISELQNRARINEAYSQGSTTLFAQNFADNADANNPAVLQVYIPAEAVRINKLILNYQLESFRAYSKSVESSDQMATTSSSGGGGITSSSSGGGGTKTSSYGGGGTKTSSIEEYIGGKGHNHGIDRGTKLAIHGSTGYATWTPSGDHKHIIDIPDHEHEIYIQAHTHEISIPNHSHEVTIPKHSHEISIPSHSHNIEFGIYNGGTASSATLRIDGVRVNIKDTEVDIIPYLSKDQDGKISRNTWHTIEIIPSSLTRVVASVFMQTFLNSRGAGDY